MEQKQNQVLSITFPPASFEEHVSIQAISLLPDFCPAITPHPNNSLLQTLSNLKYVPGLELLGVMKYKLQCGKRSWKQIDINRCI